MTCGVLVTPPSPRNRQDWLLYWPNRYCLATCLTSVVATFTFIFNVYTAVYIRTSCNVTACVPQCYACCTSELCLDQFVNASMLQGYFVHLRIFTSALCLDHFRVVNACSAGFVCSTVLCLEHLCVYYSTVWHRNCLHNTCWISQIWRSLENFTYAGIMPVR